jgi:hypothetical protein
MKMFLALVVFLSGCCEVDRAFYATVVKKGVYRDSTYVEVEFRNVGRNGVFSKVCSIPKPSWDEIELRETIKVGTESRPCHETKEELFGEE